MTPEQGVRVRYVLHELATGYTEVLYDSVIAAQDFGETFLHNGLGVGTWRIEVQIQAVNGGLPSRRQAVSVMSVQK